jgi:hypothetical protein
MKQTAVEWLVSELKKYDSAGLKDQSNYVIEMPTHILTELEKQAKEMEKQQLVDAYDDGWTVGIKKEHRENIKFKQEDFGDNYYDETFNK